jgi:hypothetical protein
VFLNAHLLVHVYHLLSFLRSSLFSFFLFCVLLLLVLILFTSHVCVEWRSLDLSGEMPTNYGQNGAHAAALYGDILSLLCFVSTDGGIVGL